MATKGQTHAKRARELALQEKRERKRAKKAEAAAQRAAGGEPMDDGSGSTPGVEGQAEREESEWIQ
jgi:hypothetical protein